MPIAPFWKKLAFVCWPVAAGKFGIAVTFAVKTHRWFQFDREDTSVATQGRVATSPLDDRGSHNTRARGHATPRRPRGEKTRRRCANTRRTLPPHHRTRTGRADPSRARDLAPRPPRLRVAGCQPCFFLKSSPSKRARLNARGSLTCSIPDPRDPTVPFTGDRTGHTRRHGCQDAAGGSGREAPEAGAPGLLPDHGGHEGLVREVHRVHRGGHRGVWNRSDRAPGGLDPASGGVRQHRLHRGPTHQAGKRQTRAERHALMRKATRFLFLPEASND